MTGDIVSAQTRRAFRESWVGFAVLREIVDDFDDAGARRGELATRKQVTGERRQLVEEYYAAVDWTSATSTQPVLTAYESHLQRLEERDAPSAAAEFARLVKHLERDGLLLTDGQIDVSTHEIVPDALVDHELTVDPAQLRASVRRVRAAIDGDPALAIGSAKELVEATCKAILVDRGKEIPAKAELPELMHLVTEELKLLPKGVSDETKGAASIRKVLGSLTQTIQGLAELRNLYGTGHGRAPGQKGLTRRHARLCAGSAATLATFLMETAVERQNTQ